MDQDISLKGGFTTTDPRLDRLPEFDERSRSFPIRTLVVADTPVVVKPPRAYTWTVGEHYLDQGREGRCVEYAICHDLLGRPVRIPIEVVNSILSGRKIYWPAQQEDEWPGGSYPGANPVYEGTSVLAGLKVATRLGFYTEYRWAFTLEEALLGLGYAGPLILGLNWYSSMFNTDANGWLQVNGRLSGGHAILAYQLKLVWQVGTTMAQRSAPDWISRLDLDASYLTLRNSWGPDWGVQGAAKLSVRNFERLRSEQGDVAIAVGRKMVTTPLAA